MEHFGHFFLLKKRFKVINGLSYIVGDSFNSQLQFQTQNYGLISGPQPNCLSGEINDRGTDLLTFYHIL